MKAEKFYVHGKLPLGNPTSGQEPPLGNLVGHNHGAVEVEFSEFNSLGSAHRIGSDSQFSEASSLNSIDWTGTCAVVHVGLVKTEARGARSRV